MIAYAVRPRVNVPAAAPLRDRKYLAFIRSHPCCVCRSWIRVEAAHVGPRGMGQKSDDRQTIPLCRKHHRGCKLSFHGLGRGAFERHYQLDIGSLIEQLREMGKR